jgi:uncharacterized protein YrrD
MSVIDLSTAEKLGNVSRIILDPNTRQMPGLEIKRGRFAAPQVVPIETVRAFGHDAITVPNTSGLGERDDFPQLAELPGLDNLLGAKIVTESGSVLGQIKDVILSDDGRRITEYEFSGGGIGALVGFGTKMLRATPQQRFGRSILTVPEADATGGHRPADHTPAH